MAIFREKIANADFEIKLPNIFSKMKVYMDGRETSIGRKAKKDYTAEFENGGHDYVVALKQRPIPMGYDLKIQRDGLEILNKPVANSGKAIDPKLVNLPKIMYVIPILSGIPIFMGGAIPALVGGIGATAGYKVLASFQDNRTKLVIFGTLNVVMTYLILLLALYGFSAGMYQAGYMSHNENLLKSIVNSTNKTLPLKLDKLTTLQKASYVNDTITFHYNLWPLNINEFNKKDFLQVMKPNLLQVACSDPQTQLLLKNKYWVQYEYKSNGIPLIDIPFSINDCNE